MQNKPPKGPFGWPAVVNLPARDCEIRGLSLTEKLRHLRICRGGLIGAARLTGGFVGRDTSAPRESRLIGRRAPRIGQTIAAELIHQNKGVKEHLLPLVMQGRNRFYYRLI